MRIVHLTTIHRGLDSRIFHKECRALAEAGHDVHLVAHDLPAEPSHGVTFHALSSAEAGGRLRRGVGRLAEAYRRARDLTPRVVHFHDPELIPVAASLRRLGSKVVYDVHEDAPTEAFTLARDRGEPFRGWLRSGSWRLFEALARAEFEAFVAATPTIAEGFPPDRTVLVRNFPRLEEFLPRPDRATGRPPCLIYVGNITRHRGAAEMLDALAEFPAEERPRLLLCGRIVSPALEKELRAHRAWPAVDFRGWRDRRQIAEDLAEADAGLLLLAPRPELLDSLPVKLFEYMAAGLPVIASRFPLWQRIIDGAGCGETVNPRRPDEVAKTMRAFLSNPERARRLGARGRAAAEREYDWTTEAATLLELYESLR